MCGFCSKKITKNTFVQNESGDEMCLEDNGVLHFEVKVDEAEYKEMQFVIDYCPKCGEYVGIEEDVIWKKRTKEEEDRIRNECKEYARRKSLR